MKFIAKSKEQTMLLASEFAKGLKGGDVVLLDGELGAGKTTFTKGIAKALGVNEEILSPTFTLFNSYDGKDFTICHFDAYRIKNSEEAVFAGLSEPIGDNECICVIEWFSNIKALLPSNAKTVKLVQLDENTREIEFC